MKRLFQKWALWLLGLASLLWLIVRSGPNPRRLMYPCQRIALANSLTFLAGPLSLLTSRRLYRWLRGVLLLLPLVILVYLLVAGGGSSVIDRTQRPAIISSLPGLSSPTAISNVYAVEHVPPPGCSLDGGGLPSEPPCNVPVVAFSDRGIAALLELMETHGEPFYRTAQQTIGLIGKADIVVIKVNNQWGGEGTGQGAGHLATNTDVLKGLIWAILSHPDGFQGEVVVAENAQPTSTNDWNAYPANAEDQGQSFLDVVTAFRSLGYPVSLYDWSALNDQRVQGGDVFAGGYPQGEYIHGDMRDAYIQLDDPQGSAQFELSYPKFRTTGGNYVSLRYGVWEDGGYQADRLKLINLPVLKRHGMSGATIAWKNLIGFITADGYSRNRFGGYAEMHDYFFGYARGAHQDYGLLGRQLALVRHPDLNLVDAIWVAYQNNTTGEAVREDILLASRDPFAVDWYASEFVLLPIVGRDEAIRRLFPEFDTRAGYRCKIVLPPLQPGEDTLNVYALTIVTPSGEEKTCRLPLPEFLQIVAASNFKQRTRMAMLYYHAESRHYAVVGTANRNEHDQGFFVKYGDGGVDVQPIVHLYKTQVYQLAEYLNIPKPIRERLPTTDTYSAYSTQQEFFFRLPFDLLDCIWSAAEHDLSPGQISRELNIDEQLVRSTVDDIHRKQLATAYLRTPPLTVFHTL